MNSNIVLKERLICILNDVNFAEMLRASHKIDQYPYSRLLTSNVRTKKDSGKENI